MTFIGRAKRYRAGGPALPLAGERSFQDWPDEHDYAGIDIFRFDDSDKIVEHRDVLQVIPAESRNDNGTF